MDQYKNNQINYDQQADILWIVLEEGEESHSIEVSPGVVLEFNKSDQIIGVEISNYMKRTYMENFQADKSDYNLKTTTFVDPEDTYLANSLFSYSYKSSSLLI